jgi:predicted amidohydrolase YtcJ
VLAADLVLRGRAGVGGKGLPAATALAARDGRVVAVGGDGDVEAVDRAGTQVVELRAPRRARASTTRTSTS